MMKAIALSCAALLVLAACTDDPPAGNAGSEDAGTQEPGPTCTAAAEQLLSPIDKVSTGNVSVVSDEGGIKTIYVDASAGGSGGADAQNPRIYVNLETASRVDVSDVGAAASTEWDLALKRPVLFTNSGDGGPGEGGAIEVDEDFAAVTAADAEGVEIATESFFFDEECTPKTDPTGAVMTTFDGWYSYNQNTHGVTPREATWLVKGGTGKLYKVQITSYSATPSGENGQVTGRYLLKVGAL